MKEDDGGGAGTCLGVLPGFITFRPLCFSPSLSLKPRSLSMNWPAIAHIVCWKIILWCSSVNFGVLGCTWVCKKITGSKQELLSLGECFVAALLVHLSDVGEEDDHDDQT